MAGNYDGAIKSAAKKIGITPQEWKRKVRNNEAWCYCCKSWVSRGMFGVDKSRGNGLASSCKRCVSIKSIASKYQISVDEARRLRSGKLKCDICDRTQKLEVDHNHNTGAIRGVLCSRCNGALGQFRDRISLLKKAIQYLEDRDG